MPWQQAPQKESLDAAAARIEHSLGEPSDMDLRMWESEAAV
jgi:hypothetical protein